MQNKFELILSDISTRSKLLKTIQEGESPDEIKQNMIAVFRPLFDNKKNLEDLVLSTLVAEFHGLLILSKTEYFDYFWDCLNTYKRAKLIEPDLSFEGIAIFEEKMTEAVNKFWSMYLLQEDLRELGDEELLFECFSKIGEITEGLTKPFLKSLLYQVKITIGEKPDHKKIESLSLGQLTDELMRKSGYPELFTPKPKNLKLHEWRNISSHHSASIENSIITCKYGQNNQKIVKLTKPEMIQTCENLFFIVDTIKLAQKIFSVDNIYEIQKFEERWANGRTRMETSFQQLALGMMTQGFEIKKFDFDKHKTCVKIFDVLKVKSDESIKRVAHSSQFIFCFWTLTSSDEVNIEYENEFGKFLLSGSGSNCQKLEKENITLSEFINKIEITDLLSGKRY
jgi:hypothetical protein